MEMLTAEARIFTRDLPTPPVRSLPAQRTNQETHPALDCTAGVLAGAEKRARLRCFTPFSPCLGSQPIGECLQVKGLNGTKNQQKAVAQACFM